MISTLLIAVALAAPIPTPTPAFELEGKLTLRLPDGMWLVTATATAAPWPTEQPTPTGDCCHHGHAWQPIKVGKEHAGGRLDLHYLEWKRRGIPEEPKEPRFYDRTSVTVQRCRRCGLWREKS